MAKKISLEEYNKKQKQKNKKIDFLKIISIVLNVILIITLIIVIIISTNNSNYLREEINVENEDKNECYNDLEYITEGESAFNIKQKIDFLDENIVFIIDGYGNYYYTYDCMMKKVGEKNYSFLAYNISAAKGEGYKKGSC